MLQTPRMCWRGQGELADTVVEGLVALIATPGKCVVAIGQGELADTVVERLSRLASDGLSPAYLAPWRP